MDRQAGRLFAVAMAGWLPLAAASQAGEAAYFRVAGPSLSTIVGFDAGSGLMAWSNAVAGATSQVQRAESLSVPDAWADYLQVVPLSPVVEWRIVDLSPPAGMVFIPGGGFQMGDNLDGMPSARPVHSVHVDAFYMDRTEVAKAHWDAVRAWALSQGYGFASAGSGKAPDHPVHAVTWHDAAKWCNARSEFEGRIPAYYTSAEKTPATVYRSGQVDLPGEWTRWDAGYRLPTEAEWEKAARGGLNGGRFPWRGDDIQHARANYHGSASVAYDTSPTQGYHPAHLDGAPPYTSPVGSFDPNGFGIHDMAGNVWEWCWDRYDAHYYAASPTANPRGPDAGSARTGRGGFWDSGASICRVASRVAADPETAYPDIGFRTVLPANE